MSGTGDRWPLVQRVAGLVVLAAAVAVVATDRGQAVAADDFLNLHTVFLPAAGLATVAAWARPTPSRNRLRGIVLSLSGALVGFEAARVAATLWLAWGRGLIFDAGLLASVGLAVVALAAGVALVGAGTRRMPEASRSRARWSLAGVVCVPLIPWLVLTDGSAASVVLFNDVTEPTFSRFPIPGLLAAGLWTVAAGGLLSGLSEVLAPRGTRVQQVGTLLGILAVAAGYGLYAWQTWTLDASYPVGTVLPLANYVPLVVAGVIAAKLRGQAPPSAVFQPTPRGSNRDR